MMLYLPAFYQHVVNVHFDIAANLIFNDLVDEVLVCGSRILPIKGHDFVTIESLVCDK